MSVDVALDNIRIKELPTINLGGGVDLDLDNIRIRELAPINFGITNLPPIRLGVTELPVINLSAGLSVERLPTVKLETQNSLQTDNRLVTDNKVDLALDVRIRELPQIDFQIGVRPMRFHFPLSYRFCLTLFGFDVLKFETCGESMIVAEDYVANESEGCH